MLRNDVLHFDYDKANLSGEDRHRLQNIADILVKHPHLGVRIVPATATSAAPEDFNLQLRPAARAAAAQKYLVDLGVDASRIATVSYGKDRDSGQPRAYLGGLGREPPRRHPAQVRESLRTP